jgi:hypothetical protein
MPLGVVDLKGKVYEFHFPFFPVEREGTIAL